MISFLGEDCAVVYAMDENNNVWNDVKCINEYYGIVENCNYYTNPGKRRENSNLRPKLRIIFSRPNLEPF